MSKNLSKFLTFHQFLKTDEIQKYIKNLKKWAIMGRTSSYQTFSEEIYHLGYFSEKDLIFLSEKIENHINYIFHIEYLYLWNKYLHYILNSLKIQEYYSEFSIKRGVLYLYQTFNEVVKVKDGRMPNVSTPYVIKFQSIYYSNGFWCNLFDGDIFANNIVKLSNGKIIGIPNKKDLTYLNLKHSIF